MLTCLLIALSVGIDVGYNTPAAGFTDLQNGPVLSIYACRPTSVADVTLSLQTAFYNGDNPAYSMSTTGFRIGVCKRNWFISPTIAAGGDYVSRALNGAGESGFALAYVVGVMLNFTLERIHVHPEFVYDGLTDLNVHAGFIGFRLGIGYEI